MMPAKVWNIDCRLRRRICPGNAHRIKSDLPCTVAVKIVQDVQLRTAVTIEIGEVGGSRRKVIGFHPERKGEAVDFGVIFKVALSKRSGNALISVRPSREARSFRKRSIDLHIRRLRKRDALRGLLRAAFTKMEDHV